MPLDRPLKALFLLICFDIMLSELVMSCGFSYFVVLSSVICNFAFLSSVMLCSNLVGSRFNTLILMTI